MSTNCLYLLFFCGKVFPSPMVEDWVKAWVWLLWVWLLWATLTRDVHTTSLCLIFCLIICAEFFNSNQIAALKSPSPHTLLHTETLIHIPVWLEDQSKFNSQPALCCHMWGLLSPTSLLTSVYWLSSWHCIIRTFMYPSWFKRLFCRGYFKQIIKIFTSVIILCTQ